MLPITHQTPLQSLPVISPHKKNVYFLLFIIMTLAIITLAHVSVTYALLAQLSFLNAAVYLCMSLHPTESHILFQPNNRATIIHTAIASLVGLMCKILIIAALPYIYTLTAAFIPAITILINTSQHYTLLLTLLFRE